MFGPWFSMTDPMWKDLERVQREIEQLFDLGTPTGNIRGVVRGTFPAVNIGETNDDVRVFVLAPGIDLARTELTLEKNLLTIVAERETQAEIGPEAKPLGYHRRERYAGKFRRVISLPEGLDTGRVDASYANGILVVTIGKKEEEKARQIDISVG